MRKLIIQMILLCSATLAAANEPVLGGPCQGCEFVFQDMPSEISSMARLVSIEAEGEQMIVSGFVYSKNGTIAPDVIVYAYQTDSNGVYPEGTNFHGSLKAWARTDSSGQFIFHTIRPGAYPDRPEPEHIHLHVIEKNLGTYFIDSIEFSDDPLLTNELRAKRKCRGGCGIVTPVKNENGNWEAVRNIKLGEGIVDYEQLSSIEYPW